MGRIADESRALSRLSARKTLTIRTKGDFGRLTPKYGGEVHETVVERGERWARPPSLPEFDCPILRFRCKSTVTGRNAAIGGQSGLRDHA